MKTKNHSHKDGMVVPMRTAYQLSSVSDELKPIFAAYYNLARQNVYMALSHITEIAGLQSAKIDEGNLSNAPILWALLPDKNKKAESRDFLMRKCIEHFPMLKAMAEVERGKNKTTLDENKKKNIYAKDLLMTPEMVHVILSNVFKVLNLERDLHTHKYLEDSRLSDSDYHKTEFRVIEYLRMIFKASYPQVRERFSLSPDDMKFITKRGAFMDMGEDKKSIYNPKYFYALSEDTTTEEQKTNKKHLIKLTTIARTLLITLFLSKKQATVFLDKLGLQFYGIYYINPNDNNRTANEVQKQYELQRMILRETFSMYKMRIPRSRMVSENNTTALAMDILNELRRCPEKLYKHISKDNQNSFIITPDEKITGEKPYLDDVRLLRYSDRFPYFALRYIDDMQLFKHMRFHVNYGKLRYVFNKSKVCADGNTEPRYLQYELNGFGRINEVEKLRTNPEGGWRVGVDMIKKAQIQGETQPHDDYNLCLFDADNSNMPPYITDTRTHYIFNNDKVGINFTIADGKLRKGDFMPEPPCVRVDGDMARLDLNESNRVKEPMCWISSYELPAMVFHSLLSSCEKDTISSTEKVIFDCFMNYRRLFESMKAESGEKSTLLTFVSKVRASNEYKNVCKQFLNKFDCSEADLMCYIDEYNHRATQENRMKYFDIDTSNEDWNEFSKCIEAINHVIHKAVESEYKIRWSDIPHKVQDYIMGVQQDALAFLKHQEAILNEEFDYTSRKLDEFENKITTIYENNTAFKEWEKYKGGENLKFDGKFSKTQRNRIGKKSFMEFKAGVLANYLASDIVRLMPTAKNGKDKPTGLNYRKLQAAIALLGNKQEGVTKDSLAVMLCKLNILGGDKNTQHPFLAEIWKNYFTDAVRFYYHYMKARKKWLKKIKEKDIVNPFGNRLQHRWQEHDKSYYNRLADEYLNSPIELPRGLFMPHIVNILAEKHASTMGPVLQNRYNTAHLIMEYHHIVRDDDMQSMYQYPRAYACYGDKGRFYTLSEREEKMRKNKCLEVYRQTLSNGETKNEKQNENKAKFDKYYKYMISNEREIRRYQVQDVLLFMMAKHILIDKTAHSDATLSSNKGLKSHFDKVEKFKLKELNNSGCEILSLTIPFELKITHTDKDGAKQQFTIKQEELKLKNYGDFYTFVHDPRLLSLLTHICSIDGIDVVIDRDALEQELDAYDNQRVDVFRSVLSVEGRIVSELNLFNKTYHDDKYVTNNFGEILRNAGINEQNGGSELTDIRNSFAHNHYPDVVFVQRELGKIATAIAKQMKDMVERLEIKK